MEPVAVRARRRSGRPAGPADGQRQHAADRHRRPATPARSHLAELPGALASRHHRARPGQRHRPTDHAGPALAAPADRPAARHLQRSSTTSPTHWTRRCPARNRCCGGARSCSTRPARWPPNSGAPGPDLSDTAASARPLVGELSRQPGQRLQLPAVLGADRERPRRAEQLLPGLRGGQPAVGHRPAAPGAGPARCRCPGLRAAAARAGRAAHPGRACSAPTNQAGPTTRPRRTRTTTALPRRGDRARSTTGKGHGRFPARG